MEALSTDAMLDEVWVLSPAVALRPEPFGAMAYHFGNRKLTFLKRPELVHVIRSMRAGVTLRTVLSDVGVSTSQWPAYLKALTTLAQTDMIRASEGNTHD